MFTDLKINLCWDKSFINGAIWKCSTESRPTFYWNLIDADRGTKLGISMNCSVTRNGCHQWTHHMYGVQWAIIHTCNDVSTHQEKTASQCVVTVISCPYHQGRNSVSWHLCKIYVCGKKERKKNLEILLFFAFGWGCFCKLCQLCEIYVNTCFYHDDVQ